MQAFMGNQTQEVNRTEEYRHYTSRAKRTLYKYIEIINHKNRHYNARVLVLAFKNNFKFGQLIFG